MNQRSGSQATALKMASAPSSDSALGRDVPAQIREALTMARNMSGGQEVRQRLARLEALRAQSAPVLQGKLQRRNLLAAGLDKADASTLRAIQDETRSELRRVLQRQHAKAIERSAEVKTAFQGAIESQREVLGRIVAGGVSPFVQQVVLDAPFLIWPSSLSSDLTLDTYQIEPWNSWAKFKVDSTSEVDAVEVDFYFFWENKTKNPVLIDVSTQLMLNGYGRTDIPQHWGDWEFSLIRIGAHLSLVEGWNQPPTSPARQASQVQKALEVSVEYSSDPFPLPFSFMTHSEGSSWWGHGFGEGVSQSYGLAYNKELVPPGGGVVIKVGPDIGWINHGNAGIEADFNSGDFQIMCPFVQVDVMIPGPLTNK